MGRFDRTLPPTNGGGGTGDNGSSEVLREIWEILNSEFSDGLSLPQTDLISLVANATPQQLYLDRRPVRKAIIQNISTEAVTIACYNDAGLAGNGFILNPASIAGEAGGSLPTGNVDLSRFYFVRATAGVTLAVYREIGL